MASIQDSPHPLVFPIDLTQQSPCSANLLRDNDTISIRTYTRSLEGMQKEALVHYGPTNTAWRMVCDEGPYLNGTDLAPFPLAFFTSGMIASFMSEILVLLKQKEISYSDITLIQDNQYSMEGSAIKGTMTGSALPVDLKLALKSEASPTLIQQVMIEAIAASPVGALLNTVLVSEFTITLNGHTLETDRVKACSDSAPQAPEGFDELAPNPSMTYPNDIVIKNKSTETVFNVAGGAGTSLSDDQKRILHIRGICTIRGDGLKDIQVQLFKPIGSMFRFLSDDSRAFNGQERAPSGLAYLSAGLAFCYMTQLGRYSHIVKKPLDLYRIVQDTAFGLPAASGNIRQGSSMEPVKTHVYIETTENAAYAQTLVDMSEQTCFLHAACRENIKVKIKSQDG